MNLGDTVTRRRLLMLLLAATVVCISPQAFAKDGDSDGGDSDGDSSGSGSGGSGNSGSGSSNSGSGGGDDDGDDHDDGDDDGDDDSSGSSSGKGKSQYDAIDAVRAGEVIPLSDAISQLRGQYAGRIIDVRLTERGSRIDYRFKVVGQDGKVVSVTMNARNGRLRGLLGF